ncbi:hypothetical protein E4U60_000026 [Claviceps pazoutovae]|uniref:MOZ protein represents a chromatin-associated acetyltransferase n=1 Tax=Claviceps pazoutovae TaxID=1649127 RepID=A0A9P7MKZ4_9HYPO|nr:hypothetical protein E4U60_000026 [Claviceps pazoutovae]
MPTGRLTFLYPPHLLRSTRTTCTAVTAARNTITTRRWVGTARSKSSFAPRHGNAVEPATWDGGRQPPRKNNNNNNSSSSSSGSGEASEVKRRDSLAMKDEERLKMPGQRGQGSAGEGTLGKRRGHGQMAAASTTAAGSALKCRAEAGTRPAKGSPSVAVTAKSAKVSGSNANSNFHSNASASASVNANIIDKSSSSSLPPNKTNAQDENSPSIPPLDAGDLVPLPSPETLRDPHMTPPPYVHHFDSYSMVKLLEGGGFSPDQAIESMKAIRTVLGGHIQVAQRNLVSKGDAENEAYLFRAACSELGTEIKTNRRLQMEQMRQQRTHLQHDLDILTQTLNQELLTLSDSVRGLFHNRNMTVREEHKAVDSAIQQINYKISVLLTSDSKSDIEGVRWVFIHRSVVGLLFLTAVLLATFPFARRKAKEEEDKAWNLREGRRMEGEGGSGSASSDAAVIQLG